MSSAPADPWERMKSNIEQLYLIEKRKLPDVVLEMKNRFNFDAVDHQYKHHFKKWQWKKNTSNLKKAQIAEQLESRARAGKPGTIITHQGRTVEPQKMRRYLKMKSRTDSQFIDFKKPPGIGRVVNGPVLSFTNSIFMKWNMPYAVMRRLYARPFDHTSPAGFSIPTPGSDIAVATPSSADSPRNAPSPTMLVLQRKVAMDRARLFAQGHHDKLLMSMNEEERSATSEWLYQYWFFCFKTAKHWGRGPPAWTAKLLEFDRFNSHTRRSLPGTPQDPALQSEEQPGDDPMPTNLCRWYIHIQDDWPTYEVIPEEEPSRHSISQDPNDESTWLPWPQEWQEPLLPARLRDALEHNDFSSTLAADLPVAIPQIAKAAERSPDELLLESLGFSIMSRNLEQVASILEQLWEKKIDSTSLYPLHLATSYLDGYKTCCGVFKKLITSSMRQSRQGIFVNELGHTVLDNLMISILKSHSSATPITVDHTWRDTARFVGEEVDICGRWDADSPCVRHLLANGKPSTPLAWKHKFCNTSIQTTCHCIIYMLEHIPSRLLKETPSGLYVRRCFDCGMKLELQPLHSLVMTAYHLASHGCQDEDLFGMLACLLCLVRCEFDPRTIANLSVTALMQTDDTDIMCDHDELTPAELAEKITAYPNFSSWSAKVRTGWTVFCGVLRLCENIQEDPSSDQDDASMDDDNDLNHYPNGSVREYLDTHVDAHSEKEVFRTRRDLATLWASVQAELLTYRRLKDGMDWVSQKFSMETLLNQLDRGEPLSVMYAEQDLLSKHCICGEFDVYPLPTLSDVIDPDLANLDVWERATYGVLRGDY